MSEQKLTYEADFYGWTIRTAQLLRAGRFGEVDVVNLAEELETLGRSEKRELKNRLTVLILHLLKWQFQAQKRSRSWELTCAQQRVELLEILEENPSLGPKVAELLPKAYEKALLGAERETKLPVTIFPKTCPYSFEQLMDQTFLPQ